MIEISNTMISLIKDENDIALNLIVKLEHMTCLSPMKYVLTVFIKYS